MIIGIVLEVVVVSFFYSYVYRLYRLKTAHPFFLEIPLERSNFSGILSLTTTFPGGLSLDLEGFFSSFIEEEIRR